MSEARYVSHSGHVTYYEILGVRTQATPEEIKQSFRRLVKKYHPDRNRRREDWANRRVRLVLEAYRTLGNAQHRLAYDRARGFHASPPKPPRTQAAAHRPATLFDHARMVLLDLMAGNGAAAVASYERLCRDHAGFSLLSYLSERDYLDCHFLLGEEYERRGRFERSLEFYEEVYNEERSEPRLRYFFDEVRDRIRNIYCRELARSAPPRTAIAYYERLLSMGMGRSEDAFFHKKISECYCRIGDYPAAREALHRAFALKPGLKGTQKICLRLGVTPPVAAAQAASY
jgi:curved DNA-binding protein CbpA